MRTSITINETLLHQAQKVTGKSGYSEAIVTSLKDYIALKARLSYLDTLFSTNLPHSYKKIKKMRKKNRWSS